MTIELTDIGRRFNRDWIFRKLSMQLNSGESYAVLGPNGSGKSTLLSVLTGSLSPSEGQILYSKNSITIQPENFYRHISLAAPYLELIEEFTLDEMAGFHTRFKPFIPGFDTGKLKDLLNLPQAKNKYIRHYSSGMKQRLKLALAMLSRSDIVVLDEPTTNLDKQGIEWYLALTERFSTGRLLVIGSNQPHEYGFCTQQIHITDYKLQHTSKEG